MSTIRSLSLIARLTLIFPCFALGCAADPESAEAGMNAGTLELPLRTSTNGHTYHLSGQLQITRQFPWQNPQWFDLGGDASTFRASLNTGEYFADLVWWGLEREDRNGSFAPVDANLVSSSSVPFRIYHGATSTIAFEFETDGAIMTVGVGSLDVRVNVTETPAACTPFTTDCGDGFWCPPSELTGGPRACVSEGPLALGESCASPLECGADSSCFDFGTGPVCARLCDVSSSGALCADGEECVPAGADYGVCTPGTPVE